jgi:hypothetical protein
MKEDLKPEFLTWPWLCFEWEERAILRPTSCWWFDEQSANQRAPLRPTDPCKPSAQNAAPGHSPIESQHRRSRVMLLCSSLTERKLAYMYTTVAGFSAHTTYYYTPQTVRSRRTLSIEVHHVTEDDASSACII